MSVNIMNSVTHPYTKRTDRKRIVTFRGSVAGPYPAMGMSENTCPIQMTAAIASCMLHSRSRSTLDDGSSASAVDGVDGGLVKLRTLENRSTGVKFCMVQPVASMLMRDYVPDVSKHTDKPFAITSHRRRLIRNSMLSHRLRELSWCKDYNLAERSNETVEPGLQTNRTILANLRPERKLNIRDKLM